MNWIPAILLLGACASVSPSPLPVTGQWGGPHIGLTLDSTGGRIEYDCAVGTIGAVMPGPGGAFRAAGTHITGFGGPEREGQVRPTQAAQFSGTIRGDRMTLLGQVADGVVLGPFELRRGAEPMLLRCL